MGNDYKRLKEEADIEAVVEHLGIKVTPRGSAKFILCPLPDHDDRHPNNCYFKKGWNNVHCCVCGRSIQAIDLIMYETGKSYGEAADELWELEGCPDWYYNQDWKKKDKKQFYISSQELEFLRIHFPKRIPRPVCQSNVKPCLREELDRGYIYADGVEGYLINKEESASWTNFMTEKAMKHLVLKRCDQMILRYNRLERSIRNRGINSSLISLFSKERKKIAELKRRSS